MPYEMTILMIQARVPPYVFPPKRYFMFISLLVVCFSHNLLMCLYSLNAVLSGKALL